MCVQSRRRRRAASSRCCRLTRRAERWLAPLPPPPHPSPTPPHSTPIPQQLLTASNTSASDHEKYTREHVRGTSYPPLRTCARSLTGRLRRQRRRRRCTTSFPRLTRTTTASSRGTSIWCASLRLSKCTTLRPLFQLTVYSILFVRLRFSKSYSCKTHNQRVLSYWQEGKFKIASNKVKPFVEIPSCEKRLRTFFWCLWAELWMTKRSNPSSVPAGYRIKANERN